MEPNEISLCEATIEDLLLELDRREYLFVFASIADPARPDHETLLCRGDKINDDQALWMLRAAAQCVADDLME